MSCTPCDHQVALEHSTADGGAGTGFSSHFKRGKGEHLAAESPEAKWQLIHTNGIWIEVEGIREEPAPASRKLLLSVIIAAAIFHQPGLPQMWQPTCSYRIPSHTRNMLRLCCLPSTFGSCALVPCIRGREHQQKKKMGVEKD